MRGRGWWWAALLVVGANLAAWAFAAANMSGEPDAVLDLTERELRLPPKEADNTAITLQLVFERQRETVTGIPVTGPRPRPREAGWFDQAKLQSIGFDCNLPVTAGNAFRYRTQPPRSTFAALEYEGAAWRSQVDAAASPDARLDTHLAAIDVDNDAAALRRRHPDRRRVAIVSATAMLQFVSNPGESPFLMGRVSQALPGEINVPREWRRLLEGFQHGPRPETAPAPLREPRYRVTVKWGKRFEPWISSVQILKP